ncbi:hypothetical protein ACSQ67_003118 [Phaseolus vulgaris]
MFGSCGGLSEKEDLPVDGSTLSANQKISDAYALIKKSLANLVKVVGISSNLNSRSKLIEAHFEESRQQANLGNKGDCGSGVGAIAGHVWNMEASGNQPTARENTRECKKGIKKLSTKTGKRKNKKEQGKFLRIRTWEARCETPLRRRKMKGLHDLVESSTHLRRSVRLSEKSSQVRKGLLAGEGSLSMPISDGDIETAILVFGIMKLGRNRLSYGIKENRLG